MNWLDPRQWLLAVVFMGVATAGFQFWKHRIEERGYDRAMQEVNASAAKRTEANRDTAKKAELVYVDREIVRTEFLTITQRELANETKNLESCILTDGAIGLLNKAADAARAD
jgi:hypothetical protein